VPVLVLNNGKVLEQSLDIMHWALNQQDKDGWLSADGTLTNALILENDISFKATLDHYKYPERYPDQSQQAYREACELFLTQLEARLNTTLFLFAEHITLADIAIFPFIRQFVAVDTAWFDRSPYPKVCVWLRALTSSELFVNIMQKQPTYML
jgi:glutathione S-transferase